MAVREGLIEIDPRHLARVREQYRDLGEQAFGKALQKSVNEVLDIATVKIGQAFEREIEGGPVPFTRVQPRTKKGSVIALKGFYAAQSGEVLGKVVVRPMQAAYLKYHLGDEMVRRPGDAGVAEEYNYIPSDVAALERGQGVRLTAQGNLPKNSLKKLIKRANATKKSKKHRPLYFGRLGTPANPVGPLGFWQTPERPAGFKGRVKKELLIHAAKESKYPRAFLLPHWNRAVEEASTHLPRLLDEYLALERTRASGSGSGGGSV
ncbi:hypothetical protein SAMN06297251_10462 [Fulvimarina manganoxydans]|uniref:Uncharacterized protein n=1 Tax=Fulvimarina manganoxydans TaxID=937218 RepID=A0A1W2ACA5_9HYPH|nr:hypothetical protein [Fulvimarina manganoxydans]SMC58250.1 hypothetical protein SAMN06297251_10462 [Fulvimarina manganoxydans]